MQVQQLQQEIQALSSRSKSAEVASRELQEQLDAAAVKCAAVERQLQDALRSQNSLQQQVSELSAQLAAAGEAVAENASCLTGFSQEEAVAKYKKKYHRYSNVLLLHCWCHLNP